MSTPMVDFDDSPMGGSNFLVSAVVMLQTQRRELLNQVQELLERIARLENQNATFMKLSADRLLEKQGLSDLL